MIPQKVIRYIISLKEKFKKHYLILREIAFVLVLLKWKFMSKPIISSALTKLPHNLWSCCSQTLSNKPTCFGWESVIWIDITLQELSPGVGSYGLSAPNHDLYRSTYKIITKLFVPRHRGRWINSTLHPSRMYGLRPSSLFRFGQHQKGQIAQFLWRTSTNVISVPELLS